MVGLYICPDTKSTDSISRKGGIATAEVTIPMRGNHVAILSSHLYSLSLPKSSNNSADRSQPKFILAPTVRVTIARSIIYISEVRGVTYVTQTWKLVSSVEHFPHVLAHEVIFSTYTSLTS